RRLAPRGPRGCSTVRPPPGPACADRVPSAPVYTPPIDILLICTANQCRSAMAEGMLRRLLTDHGAYAEIGSAGLLRGGAPATRDAGAVLADAGGEHPCTLKELVRGGASRGPRRPDETVFDWLARVAAGRHSADLMGEDDD